MRRKREKFSATSRKIFFHDLNFDREIYVTKREKSQNAYKPRRTDEI